MEFLNLLAGALQYVVTAPVRAIEGVRKWTSVTRQVDAVKSEAGGAAAPLQKLSGAARFFRGVGTVLFVLILVGAFVGILFGLWYLNRRLDLPQHLGRGVAWLYPYWLPLLFLLLCALGAAGWWVWRLLGPEREPEDFPDILEAWHEARAALQQAGISLTDVPLFLVLGRPAAGAEGLFGASRLPFPVRQMPRRAGAPVQVYANEEGIFVTCPGASLLGRLAELLSGAAAATAAPADAPRVASVFDEPPAETAEPADGTAGPAADEALLLPDDGARAPLAAEEPARAPRPELLKNTQAVERLRARLVYLGKLLARDRRPYCPANGLLVLVPFAAVATEADAAETATLGQLDLTMARAGLGVDCPVFVLVCDLETAPGFGTFLRRLPEERRQRLLGHGLPLVPDVTAAEMAGLVEAGAAWLGRALARLVYRLLRTEEPGGESAWDAARDNAALFRFVSAFEQREKYLARLLARFAVPDVGPRLLYGGCYLAATGTDPQAEQAFVVGAFRLLIENQNHVAWTPAALAEEASHRTWTTYGYLGIAAVTVAVALYVYAEWPG
jgi:IcmF-related N-terminal domain